jgi:hypothetical protein
MFGPCAIADRTAVRLRGSAAPRLSNPPEDLGNRPAGLILRSGDEMLGIIAIALIMLWLLGFFAFTCPPD